MSQLDKIKRLMESSMLFTDDQKKSWTDLLPKMNDQELGELYQILVDEVKELKKEGLVLIADENLESELTGTPLAKKVINVPKPAVAIPVPQAAAPAAAARKIEDVQPMPVAKALAIAVADPKPIQSLKSISDIKNIEDLSKIQVAHLRQGDLAVQLGLIKNKIMSLAKSNKVLPYVVVAAFERSPLFQTYLTIGANLIFDENPNRETAFQQAVQKSLGGGNDVLERKEFEAIADLRKQIEQY